MIGQERTAPPALLPDEARYLDEAEPGAFVELYSRHRECVRRALESAGLARLAAEWLVAEVFSRMMDRREVIDRSGPLSQTLSDLAHAVAADVPPPHPDQPFPPPAHNGGHGLGTRSKDGFYGSGAGT